MKATNWEFNNRAMVFGWIFGLSFLLYFVDHQNATSAVADALAARLGDNPDSVARVLLAIAAALLIGTALIRTWASAYLRADVVYAAQIKTAALVADGPYRQVRNPLYFANFLMGLGMGAMASRSGFFVLTIGMTVFCYRLIFREEAELLAAQGESYAQYCRAVPRFWPAVTPRLPASPATVNWGNGFRAEVWCWGFAAALVVFAITLKLGLFFAILGLSFVAFWIPKKKEAVVEETAGK
jgi:protein-S-isoprenylcysteine O-methyltransferase Ste14